MGEDEKLLRVGTNVLIFKEGKILLGKRIGGFGTNTYQTPGGHLEYMESAEECLRRETREEAGIEIKNVKFLFAMNFRAYAPRHYAHFGFTANWESGEPIDGEPDKCTDWKWYDLDNIPQPLFRGTEISLEAYRTGKTFFDI